MWPVAHNVEMENSVVYTTLNAAMNFETDWKFTDTERYVYAEL